MSLSAHQNLSLQEFKEYGIIDYVEGKRKKPENPEDYDKLTDKQKKEIEPRVTINYFKLLQQEVKSQKQKLVELFNEISNLKATKTKKGGKK